MSDSESEVEFIPHPKKVVLKRSLTTVKAPVKAPQAKGPMFGGNSTTSKRKLVMASASEAEADDSESSSSEESDEEKRSPAKL